MRRFLGIAAGVLAAIIGTIVLMSVVEDRANDANKGPELGSVLVVKKLIPRQTSVELISTSLEVTQIPVDLIAPGAVASLDQIQSGLVTATELLPGEQLLIERFVDPRVQDRLVVPDGLQEVTISLPVPRVLGGELIAGDTVGVIASFTVKVNDEDVPSTAFLLHKVLVTSVQFSNNDATAIEQSLGTTQYDVNRYPNDSILVTLAVSSEDAARIVYASEFGTMWLTLEGSKSSVGNEGVTVITDVIPVPTP